MSEQTSRGPTLSTASNPATPSASKRGSINKIKVKLVGEMALSNDAPGFDPYNSSGGKTTPAPWRRREDRR